MAHRLETPAPGGGWDLLSSGHKRQRSVFAKIIHKLIGLLRRAPGSNTFPSPVYEQHPGHQGAALSLALSHRLGLVSPMGHRVRLRVSERNLLVAHVSLHCLSSEEG